MTLEPYADLIKAGEVVAFPTETVYGLGADALNPLAIKKVFEIKGRPADNPLIIHVSTREEAFELAQNVPEKARMLMDHFWPGPLTLVLPGVARIPDIATAGLETVALRMPDHPLALELLRLTGPLVAPSANKSGRPSPTKPEHVREDFGDDIAVIDGGATRVGLESTVLDCSRTPWQILRPGAVGPEEIEDILNVKINSFEERPPEKTDQPRSPGQKYRHYSPNAQVQWMEINNENTFDQSDVLYLVHSLNNVPDKDHIIHFQGDLKQMGRQIYDLFRYADARSYKAVHIQPFSTSQKETTQGAALYNRISKAIG